MSLSLSLFLFLSRVWCGCFCVCVCVYVCVCVCVVVVQLICRIVKMGWFDIDAKDTHVMRDLVSRVTQFLNVCRARRPVCGHVPPF